MTKAKKESVEKKVEKKKAKKESVEKKVEKKKESQKSFILEVRVNDCVHKAQAPSIEGALGKIASGLPFAAKTQVLVNYSLGDKKRFKSIRPLQGGRLLRRITKFEDVRKLYGESLEAELARM